MKKVFLVYLFSIFLANFWLSHAVAIDEVSSFEEDTEIQAKESMEQSNDSEKLNSSEKLQAKLTQAKAKKRKKRRRRINRKKLEAYIQRGLRDGTLSLDRLNRIESRYLKQKLRYEPYVNAHPYLPHKWDYGLELGQMNIDKDLYWLGGNLGYNIGTCVLTNSQSCQQYMDFLIGSSGRDGETNWYGVLSLRWQFVNFPDTNSPIARVFAGVMNRIADDSSKQFFVYGLGYGITTYLHPRADLRLEGRLGWGREVGSFTQLFVSMELKVSRWLDFFAGKLEGVGVGAGKVFKKGIGTTGGVIKSGVHGTRDVLKKGHQEIKSAIQGQQEQEGPVKPEGI